MTVPSQATWRILELHERISHERCLLVGISGIDGSGKGFITSRLESMLTTAGRSVAAINVDGWLRLPRERFNPESPARHFYNHAIRFEEMFSRLILPLRSDRSICIAADLADPTDRPTYYKHTFAYADVDIILLEGIFLFKRAFRRHFDLRIWVDCTYDTALGRALDRSQEGLAPEETIRAYESIYFPAQRIHEIEDEPRGSADLIVANDHRLVTVNPARRMEAPLAAS